MPMIPATTLAGALRAEFDEEKARSLFGFQGLKDGQRSALIFTDALAHCANNKPCDGWRVLPDPEKDEIVGLLLQDSPITRQHVRLNKYGVTHREGKFERSALPAGTRLTFEVSCWGDGVGLKTVAAIIRRGLFLGGAKRSGYGGFACVADGKKSFDLTVLDDAMDYRSYARTTLSDSAKFEILPLATNTKSGAGWLVSGKIEGPLLIGAPRSDGRGGRQPYGEVSINWKSEVPTVAPAEVVVPGSAIKGPLRHRMRFHLKRLGHADADAATEALFGSADDTRGHAGKLRFYDAKVIGGTLVEVTHVSLDRFTGGARDKSGALFADKMLWRPCLEIRIDPLEAIPSETAQAFDLALADLKAGVLGIGAEWGEGAGVFESCNVTKVPGVGEYA